jgi:hypothetical protein
LENLSIYPSQVLNPESEVVPSIQTFWRLKFNGFLNVNFSETCELKSIERKDNYICYHGNMDKISLSNNKNKHLVYLNFTQKSKNVLLLFLNKRNKFLIITVNSKEDFGMEALEIFDI